MRLFSAVLLLFVVAVSAANSQTITGPTSNVPSTYFAMHNIMVSHWPSVPFGTVNPAMVTWNDIEPTNGNYHWSNLDNFVAAAQSRGVGVTYIFMNTPQWASTKPTQYCYRGYVGCAAPPHLTDWDEFVGRVVTRYKGRIKSYELWNEPNDLNFYNGSVSQLLAMAQHAYGLIKSIDSSATVLTPAPTWKPTSTAWSWMGTWLSAGGGNYANVLAFHGYTGSAKPEGVLTIINNVRSVAHSHGVYKPLWISEGGWGKDSVVTNLNARAAALVQRELLTWADGAARFYWFEWDNQNYGTLWDPYNGMHPAGKAYGLVYRWMVGARVSNCTKYSNYTWVCQLYRSNGYTARAIWNESTSLSYTIPSGYHYLRDIFGNKRSVTPGSAITVNNYPILLENFSVF